MTGDNGVILLGTLDVDENRARFVASSGLFGTAYQFVMPRDQIQIVRVPSASAPYNALELHTKYRQNILCDFDDNVSVFRQVVDVMKCQLPQESPMSPSSPRTSARRPPGGARRRRETPRARGARASQTVASRRASNSPAVRHPPL